MTDEREEAITAMTYLPAVDARVALAALEAAGYTVARLEPTAIFCDDDSLILISEGEEVMSDDELLYRIVKEHRSLLRGMEQAAAGDLVDLGDFSQYAREEPVGE